MEKFGLNELREKYLSFFEVMRSWLSNGCMRPMEELLSQLWTVFDRSLEPARA